MANQLAQQLVYLTGIHAIAVQQQQTQQSQRAEATCWYALTRGCMTMLICWGLASPLHLARVFQRCRRSRRSKASKLLECLLGLPVLGASKGHSSWWPLPGGPSSFPRSTWSGGMSCVLNLGGGLPAGCCTAPACWACTARLHSMLTFLPVSCTLSCTVPYSAVQLPGARHSHLSYRHQRVV